jgi:uncharacterized repeat protein (TIGR02543 family)
MKILLKTPIICFLFLSFIVISIIKNPLKQVFANELRQEIEGVEIIEPPENNNSIGVHNPGIVIPSVQMDSDVNRTGAVLPVRFDAREKGWVTPVKNQGNYGTCWAFTGISSIESSMISNGFKIKGKKVDNTLDLSELHLSYFTYNPVTDPLGNTKGDTSNKYPKNAMYHIGANEYNVVMSLASWSGVVNEKTVPYSRITDNKLEHSLAYKSVARLQNANFISMQDTNEVKKEIMKKGSVSTLIYLNDIFKTPKENSYYYDGRRNLEVNHAVSIVGWDDKYSKENFNTSPTKDGAWLVKNSYGFEMTDDGYLWVSYEDYSLIYNSGTLIPDGTAVSFSMESNENYDNNYQYDGTRSSIYIQSQNSIRVGNIFKASAAPKNHSESLKAVSFLTYSSNVNYSIEIYKDLKDRLSPISGTKVFSTPVKGKKVYAGYHTIKLPKDVKLSNNSLFSVVVTLSSSNSKVSLGIDKSDDTDYYVGNNYVEFINSSQKGESFISYNGRWIDYGQDGISLRVKAFTNNEQVIKVQSIKPNSKNIAVKKGGSIKLNVKIVPTNVDNKGVIWSSEDPKIAYVSTSGKITGKKNGTTTITVKAKDGSGKKATCKVTVGYPIYYKLNGGKNDSDNPKAYYKTTIKLKKPTRKGYKFLGWYKDKRYKNKISLIRKNERKSYTIYARWQRVLVAKPTIKQYQKIAGSRIKIKYLSKLAKGYEIVCSQNRDFQMNGLRKINTKKTYCDILGLNPKTKYYIKVRAYKFDSSLNKVFSKYVNIEISE